MPKGRWIKPTGTRRATPSPLWLRVLLAVVIVLLMVYAVAPIVVARVADRALREAGFPGASIGRAQLTWGRVRLMDVVLDAGGMNRIQQADAWFSLNGLREGALDRVGLAGVRLELRPWGPGAVLPGWLPGPEMAAGDGWPGLLSGAIAMRDVAVTVATPAGALLLASSGFAVNQGKDGAIAVEGPVRVEHSQAVATGTAAIRVAPDDERIDVKLNHLTLPVDELTADGFSGRITAHRQGADLSAAVALDGKIRGQSRAGTFAVALRLHGKDVTGNIDIRSDASQVSARLRMSPSAGGARTVSGNVRVKALDPALIGRGEGRIDGAVDFQGTAAPHAAHLTVSGQGAVALKGFRLTGLRLKGPLSMALVDGEIALTVPDCMQLQAANVETGATHFGPVATTCLQSKPDVAILTLFKRAGGRLGMASEGRIGQLDLAWRRSADGAPRQFALGKVRWTFDRGDGFGHGAVDAELRDASPSPWFTPVDLSVKVRGDIPDRIVVDGKGAQTWGGLTFEGHFQWGPAAIGGARLRVGPIRIAPDANWRARALPGLTAIDSIAGDFEAMGEAAWDRKGANNHGVLQVKGGAITAAGITASGIDATLNASRLVPLVLPAPQHIHIDTLDLGIPLRNVSLNLGLAQDRRLTVSEARAEWAGGTVTAYPFATAPDNGGQTTTVLVLSDIAVAKVLALIGIDGLSGTGTLSGHVPLRLADGKITVRDASLESSGGTIAYQPDHPPVALSHGQAAVALKALQNFHYDRLSLALDGVSGGESRAVLVLGGRNPDLYDGKAVRFTLNLTGALDTILRRGVAAYHLPDRIQAQIKALDQN